MRETLSSTPPAAREKQYQGTRPGAGEMAEWRRTLAAPAEDMGSSPSSFLLAHNIYSS